MPRIFLLGASGSLGSSLCTALVSTGEHTVFGHLRSQSKSASLAANEVYPVVIADATSAEGLKALKDVLRKERIDVVIDVTAAYGDSVKFLEAAKEVSAERSAAFADTPKGQQAANGMPKMGYVYTSGQWVHGSSLTNEVSDLDPVGTATSLSPPLEMVSWRPELEQTVLAARDVLDVLIMRPGLLYGRASASWGALFGPILGAVMNSTAGEKGKVSVKVNVAPRSMSPIVHVDDIASAIALGVAKLESLRGIYPVFDIASSTENVRDIMEAYVAAVTTKESGKEGVQVELELTGPGDDVWMKALGASVLSSSVRAKEILGWQPKRVGFARHMPTYALAWKASQK